MGEGRQQVKQMAADAQQGWGMSYPLFTAVIATRGLRRGVEVGVAFGGHSEAILETPSVERLWAVDPFMEQSGYDDPCNFEQATFNEIHEFVQDRLARFGTRAELLRMTSAEAASVVPDEIDFVYIDAMHTCEAVWDDLNRWARKVRPGGIVGGHDYGHVNFPGVKLAIDTFSERAGWPITEEGEGVWWMPRGTLPDSLGRRPRLRGQNPVVSRMRNVADRARDRVSRL